MKIRAIIAALVLGLGSLAYATSHPIQVHAAGPPTPLCGPNDPKCTLDN